MGQLIGDLCDEKLCSFDFEEMTRKHIACLKDNNFPSSCPPKAKLIEFTPTEQGTILNLHNRIRNCVASGHHKSYKPAERMAFMQWDDSLAYVASFNVKTCLFEHDQCRNTKEFRNSGQNLGLRTTSIRAKSRREKMKIFVALMNMWVEEGNVYCNQSFIDSFKPHPNATLQIGHFTELVRDENAFVGCSAIEFSRETMWHYLFACNYATTNFLDEKVYTSGSKCSACLSGCHKKYKALCSERELYQLNLH